MAGRLRVTLVKSTIGHIARNRGTVRALGLRRIGHTVEVADNPATRGMVRQVRFLVSVEALNDGARRRRSPDEAAAGDAPAEVASTTAGSGEPVAADTADGGPAVKPAVPAAGRSRRKAAPATAEETS
jgi:large subunit ribosomal protein L30